MEVKAFQPAWWCHGGEKVLVLIPGVACFPTFSWDFSSFLPNTLTERTGHVRLHLCVLGWTGDPVRVDSCLSPSEPWDKLQHPIIQIRNKQKQNLDGLKVLLLLRYFNS